MIKMISEPSFRDLIRDMPRILGGVPPLLHKKHIEAAGFEAEKDSVDPFDDDKTLRVSELIRIFWKPSKGRYEGEGYDIKDLRFISMYKGLVPEYETIPNAHVHDHIFVKVFNLMINAWIDYESESPTDLHLHYIDFQSYFSNKSQFESEKDVEKGNDFDSSSQHQELLTNHLKKSRKTIQALRRNKKLLMGELLDSDIEKLADQARLKNGRLSYTKLGKLLDITRQTASKLILERKLSYLLTPPA
ncbi:MAG: hypothetical protein HN757_18690 [Calditrichaeota bacterium]|jgi:hypothetical protein|nr:hypothetical protein [Calditrichota bacterium]